MSTPKLPIGVWMLVRMTGPKCLRMSLSVLEPVVTYLKEKKIKLVIISKNFGSSLVIEPWGIPIITM